MFYKKNLPTWERVLRVIIGLAALATAAFLWGTAPWVAAPAAIGGTMALTGLVGFCPMCALVGRQLK